jgi:hypothetical protein
MMNWKGSGRTQSWPGRGAVPAICLEGLGKFTKNLRIVGVSSEIRTENLLNIYV